MGLTIEPASVTVAAQDTQVFSAKRDGQPVHAEWRVVGKGMIGANNGAYEAPAVLFISKKAAIVAKSGDEEIAATVIISAAHTWIPALSIYLCFAALVTLAGLFQNWSPDSPSKIAFLAGALGACLHGINSLVAYTGNRQFLSSWGPYYLFRPFTGGILAVIVGWAYRGRLGGDSPGDPTTIYFTAAVAGLAGLFSDVALKKLEGVVAALFSATPDQRGDRLRPARASKPVISGTNPATLQSSGQAQPLEITGTGLVTGSTVKVNGSARTKTSETPPTKLVIELEAADVQSAGTLNLVVESPQGTASDEFAVEVVAP